MAGTLNTQRANGFARRFDAFSYKRLVDLSDVTNPSNLGAILTIIGSIVLVLLVLAETAAYIAPTLHQEVIMANSNSPSVRVTFNVTFPALPCHLLSVDISDALGLHAINISDSNIQKFKIDAKSGKVERALAANLPTTLKYEEKRRDSEEAPSEFHSTPLNPGNFQEFVAGTDVAMVSYGASWCPWSRKLGPIWEEVAGIVSTVEGVRLGRVDCTDPQAVQLCQEAHVAAFPTILLFKGGSPHSHTHYHGDRTVQAILNFLVVARQDSGLNTNPHAEGAIDPHEAVERIARQLKAMGESLGAEHEGHGHEDEHPDEDGKVNGRDPADPGPAIALIEAMHRAGLPAPGDAARAALGAVLGTPTPAGKEAAGDDPSCDPETQARKLMANPQAEGCRIAGYLDVKRVPGNIRFSPGAGGMTLNVNTLNMTHVINEFFFGPRVTSYQLGRLPSGTEKELHRLRNSAFVSSAANMSHEHYVSVVGSTFRFSTGHVVETFRYTAHSHSFEDARAVSASEGGAALAGSAVATNDGLTEGVHDKAALPSVRISYELSPMAVVVSEVRKPTYQFITSLCAIVGGVFTVIGLFDSLVHTSLKTFRYKKGIGKQG